MFALECYNCGHKWDSADETEDCPYCEEDNDIGVDEY